jgi:hypothetical protein
MSPCSPAARAADRRARSRKVAERIPIDPKADGVWIRLCTEPEHKGVCIGSLNAALTLGSPVVDIEVQPPFVMRNSGRNRGERGGAEGPRILGRAGGCAHVALVAPVRSESARARSASPVEQGAGPLPP